MNATVTPYRATGGKQCVLWGRGDLSAPTVPPSEERQTRPEWETLPAHRSSRVKELLQEKQQSATFP